MKRILPILFIGLLFGMLEANGQRCLKPARNVWEQPLSDYELEVKNTLFGDSITSKLGMTYLRYWILPAWGFPEYILELKGRHLIYREVDNSLWIKTHPKDEKIKKGQSAETPIQIISKELSKESRICILNLFRNALLSARFPEYPPLKGCDYSTHYFSFYNSEMMTATAFLPIKGSNVYNLIYICEDITVEIKNTPGDIMEFSPGLLERMQNLIKKMPQPGTPLADRYIEARYFY